MILKRAALGISALALAISATLGATSGAAQAGPKDNASATVAGVTPVAATACPYQNFCLYTQSGLKGNMFALFNCKTYTLSNWNGEGSFFNNNSGGAVANILDKNRKVIMGSNPVKSGVIHAVYVADFNFNPAWYVKPC